MRDGNTLWRRLSLAVREPIINLLVHSNACCNSISHWYTRLWNHDDWFGWTFWPYADQLCMVSAWGEFENDWYIAPTNGNMNSNGFADLFSKFDWFLKFTTNNDEPYYHALSCKFCRVSYRTACTKYITLPMFRRYGQTRILKNLGTNKLGLGVQAGFRFQEV